MKQARYLNGDCDIYLLTDSPLFNASHREFLAQEQISLVDVNLMPCTPEHAAFRKDNKIDPALSDGLWMYAVERFFYLFDFIKDRSLENVIHLENDSMLYVDLNELMPPLKKSDMRLAAPFQSAAGCIPCFVFIKDTESLLPLMHHILSAMRDYKGPQPHIGVNDMQTLASFYQKFGEAYMAPLPTLMPEYSEHCPKRRSFFEPDNRTPLGFLSMNANLFSGYLFDAAALGVFANGNDKKFFPKSGPGAIHCRSLFDPHYFAFYWGADAQGKNVPFLSFRGKSYRIVNMHFHSKMADEYASYEETRKEFPIGRHL
jgi:hypothetical protein